MAGWCVPPRPLAGSRAKCGWSWARPAALAKKVAGMALAMGALLRALPWWHAPCQKQLKQRRPVSSAASTQSSTHRYHAQLLSPLPRHCPDRRSSRLLGSLWRRGHHRESSLRCLPDSLSGLARDRAANASFSVSERLVGGGPRVSGPLQIAKTDSCESLQNALPTTRGSPPHLPSKIHVRIC